MKVINMFGGPGSGKSTCAAALFVHLKNLGKRTELVGEEAKDQIYWGSVNQLTNQFLLAGLQYARLKNLEDAGCELAIADSPLIQNPVYARNAHYYNELLSLVSKINSEFHNINVYVTRVKPYDTFGRVQKNEEEARAVDAIVKSSYSFDVIVPGNSEGQKELGEWLIKLLHRKDTSAQHGR